MKYIFVVERVDSEMVAWLGEICNWEDYESACLKFCPVSQHVSFHRGVLFIEKAIQIISSMSCPNGLLSSDRLLLASALAFPF